MMQRETRHNRTIFSKLIGLAAITCLCIYAGLGEVLTSYGNPPPNSVTITYPTQTASQWYRQFAFDTGSPGVCDVFTSFSPAEATASPSYQTQYISWSLTAISGSTQTKNQTPGSEVNKVWFRHSGLPSTYTQFGPKTLRAAMLYGGTTYDDTRTVFVFFFPQASNHPGSGTAPNWFYYWKQAIQEDYPDAYYAIYDPDLTCPGIYYHGDVYVYIGELASGHSAPKDVPPHPSSLNLYGIDTLPSVIIHELQHKSDYEEFLNKTDTDGDGIADYAEEGTGYTGARIKRTEPDDDTTYETNGILNDFEYRAQVKEYEISPDEYASKDWSEGGKQWATD